MISQGVTYKKRIKNKIKEEKISLTIFNDYIAIIRESNKILKNSNQLP